MQDGRQVERRTADHLQHLGSRGLLRERLLDLPGARLHLVEHLRVLDRDRSLVGETLEEGDLPVREGLGLEPLELDDPGDLALTEEWNAPRSWQRRCLPETPLFPSADRRRARADARERCALPRFPARWE